MTMRLHLADRSPPPNQSAPRRNGRFVNLGRSRGLGQGRVHDPNNAKNVLLDPVRKSDDRLGPAKRNRPVGQSRATELRP